MHNLQRKSKRIPAVYKKWIETKPQKNRCHGIIIIFPSSNILDWTSYWQKCNQWVCVKKITAKIRFYRKDSLDRFFYKISWITCLNWKTSQVWRVFDYDFWFLDALVEEWKFCWFSESFVTLLVCAWKALNSLAIYMILWFFYGSVMMVECCIYDSSCFSEPEVCNCRVADPCGMNCHHWKASETCNGKGLEVTHDDFDIKNHWVEKILGRFRKAYNGS